MKILLITQWYKPLRAAAANRTSRIAEYLAQKHEVLVLTGMPSYPTGILPEKYRKKIIFREKIENVNILRTYEFPSPNTGTVKRLVNNISFLISSIIALCFLKRFDLIIVSSPPFISGIAGLFAKMIFRAKLIFDIRDLWPDSAIELGFLKPGLLETTLLNLEKKYYQASDKILTATPTIKNHLLAENIPANKIIALLNTVDTSLFYKQTIEKKEFGFKNSDFIIAYTGNIGAAQGLENTIKSAEILKNHSDIKFLFVGEGEEKLKLIDLVKTLKLNNVIFWPEKTKIEIAKIINISDIGNIALAPQKLFQQAIPSKALEYFACAKPVVASLDGDLGRYIKEYQAGLIYSSNDPKSLADAILTIYKSKGLAQKMGSNAYKLVQEKFASSEFYRLAKESLEL